MTIMLKLQEPYDAVVVACKLPQTWCSLIEHLLDLFKEPSRGGSVYCIALYLYIYIALLALHASRRRFHCKRPREKKAVFRERLDALGSHQLIRGSVCQRRELAPKCKTKSALFHGICPARFTSSFKLLFSPRPGLGARLWVVALKWCCIYSMDR